MALWTSVLTKLYETEQESGYYKLVDSAIDDTHPLADDMGLKGGELKKAARFLKENDLIEKKDSEGFYEISEKGFEVAREERLQSTQKTHNRWLVTFTGLLVIVSIVNAIPEIVGKISLVGSATLGLALMLLSIVVGLGIGKIQR